VRQLVTIDNSAAIDDLAGNEPRDVSAELGPVLGRGGNRIRLIGPVDDLLGDGWIQQTCFGLYHQHVTVDAVVVTVCPLKLAFAGVGARHA